MLVLVNGEASSQTSALDRGLLYGQSVFETIAVANSKPCLLGLHLARLSLACNTLDIPIDLEAIKSDLEQVLVRIKGDSSLNNRAVIRLTLTMGEGGRGYLNPSEPDCTRIVSVHHYPDHPTGNWLDGIKLGVASIRLSHQPALAGIKHGNRLEQIIARSQWQSDWNEALLLDHNDNVIEATQSNVFIVKGNSLYTPCLELAGVAGVMREYIISKQHNLGLKFESVSLSLKELKEADEVFLSNSVIGVWPVKQLGDHSYSCFKTSRTLLKLMIENEVIPNYTT